MGFELVRIDPGPIPERFESLARSKSSTTLRRTGPTFRRDPGIPKASQNVPDFAADPPDWATGRTMSSIRRSTGRACNHHESCR
jgi:hypothetical protein